MRYAIVFFLFLCACNHEIKHEPVVEIQPAFQAMVDEFVAESYNQGRPVSVTDLIVRFAVLDDYILGECYDYNGAGTNLVLINSKYWPYESLIYNKVTMFHELGHCLLHREHVQTGVVRNGFCTATSIMWPYVINATNMYVENWNEYMVELFTGASSGTPCSFNNYWGGT